MNDHKIGVLVKWTNCGQRGGEYLSDSDNGGVLNTSVTRWV